MTGNIFFRAFRIMEMILRVTIVLLAWIAIIAVIIFIAVSGPQHVRGKNLLVIKPSGSLADASFSSNFLNLNRGAESVQLSDLVKVLNYAAEDENILGVHLDLNNFNGGGPASINELSEAVRNFRASGKEIVASAHSYNTNTYRVAAASSYVFVDRLGGVFIDGYMSWNLYFGDALERLGVDVKVTRSGEAKSFGEVITRKGMSDVARNNTSNLLNSLWDVWLDDVADDRGLERQALSNWIEQYDDYLLKANGNSSASALSAKLVDAVNNGSEIVNYIDEYFGSVDRIEYTDYLDSRTNKEQKERSTIAVIPFVGTLNYQNVLLTSDVFIRTIEKAANRKDVKAVVIRINSPGGDVRAGEDIRRALENVRKKLPVVASFGNLAASGGYWIALESDVIVSSSDSITGSIGVLHVAVDIRAALSQWLGINVDGVGTTVWSDRGNQFIDKRMQNIYSYSVNDINTMFRSLINRKRNISMSKLENLADGRVWSGQQALELGFIDYIGGLNFAIEMAAKESKLSSWKVEYFQPGEEEFFRLLRGLIGSSLKNLIFDR